VDLNRGTASNAYAPVLYWDSGMPPFTGTLPSKDPTLQNGSGISWTLPNGLAQGYIQNWSFGVQRELLRQITIEANYVGTKGTRLPGGTYHLAALFNMTPSRYLAWVTPSTTTLTFIPNSKPYPSFEGTVNQALRPFPQYQSINLTGFHVGSSIYHSHASTGAKTTRLREDWGSSWPILFRRH